MGKYIELSRQALQPIGGMYQVVVTQLLELAYTFVLLSVRNTEKSSILANRIHSWTSDGLSQQDGDILA